MRCRHVMSLFLSAGCLLGASEATTLKEAHGRAFALGAAIPGLGLNTNEQSLLARNFTTVTPENCFKPKAIHPDANRYDFRQADALVTLARRHGLTVNAHTLVWHEACPDWFFTDDGKPADRDLVLKRLRDHIATVAGHFAGQVASWDVVNEAIADGKPENYLRPTRWLKALGPDYLAEAFRAARKADPSAKLYYNDYEIEVPVKRTKALRLIKELRAQGVVVDGIGIQGHWVLDHIPFQEIEASLIAFHAEGLAVAISELDLDPVPRHHGGADTAAREKGGDPAAGGLTPNQQQRLAEQYGRLFALFRKHQNKIARVTFWGLHDGRSWLNTWPWKRTNHPLLWDRDLRAKPALTAVLAAGQP